MFSCGVISNTASVSSTSAAEFAPFARPKTYICSKRTAFDKCIRALLSFTNNSKRPQKGRQFFPGAVAEEGSAGNSFQPVSNGATVRLIATQMVSPKENINYQGTYHIDLSDW
jgi:hypothetical protein